MNSPNKIKAIVLTCDRYRAITRHLVFQYDRLWPDHPFVFHVPYQELGGTDTNRVKYFPSPSDIKGTVLHLLADIDDEEWIYWSVDDKYPIQLPTEKVTSLISHAMRLPEIDGLLFCRCRATLSSPWFPSDRATTSTPQLTAQFALDKPSPRRCEHTTISGATQKTTSRSHAAQLKA